MKSKMRLKVGLVGLVAVGLTAAWAAPAMADYAPQPGDVVGVGGDTPQYALQFGADGDYLGDAGFNAAGAYNRLVTFNAHGGRATAARPTRTAAPPSRRRSPLNPTDVLRAGTFPVQRVQSSGAGDHAHCWPTRPRPR